MELSQVKEYRLHNQYEEAKEARQGAFYMDLTLPCFFEEGNFEGENVWATWRRKTF